MPRLSLLTTVLALAACASAPPQAPPVLAGSYALTRINGQPLPAQSPGERGITVPARPSGCARGSTSWR